jgi:hypothetical protein
MASAWSSLMTRGPGEGAIGLPMQREAEVRFDDRMLVHDEVVDARADLLPKHGAPTAADHHDHQRPEAPRDAYQRR